MTDIEALDSQNDWPGQRMAIAHSRVSSVASWFPHYTTHALQAHERAAKAEKGLKEAEKRIQREEEVAAAAREEGNSLRLEALALKDQLRHLGVEVEEKARDSELYREKIAHTQDVQMELSHSIQELTTKNTRLAHEVSELRDQVRQLKDERSHLEQSLASKDSKLAQLSAQMENASGRLGDQTREKTALEEQLAAKLAENRELSKALSETSNELQLAAPKVENTRALEALVADMVEKNHRLEEELRGMETSMTMEQQAQLGSHNTLRMHLEELGRQNENLTMRLREEQVGVWVIDSHVLSSIDSHALSGYGGHAPALSPARLSTMLSTRALEVKSACERRAGRLQPMRHVQHFCSSLHR